MSKTNSNILDGVYMYAAPPINDRTDDNVITDQKIYITPSDDDMRKVIREEMNDLDMTLLKKIVLDLLDRVRKLENGE